MRPRVDTLDIPPETAASRQFKKIQKETNSEKYIHFGINDKN